MPMTTEVLDMIELDAAVAPAAMISHYITVVGESLPDAAQDIQEHAKVLLLKLEQLLKNQRAEPADASPQYLAPWLTLGQPAQAAA